MLIRITRPSTGEVEGVDLSVFRVGATYDVASALGTYLLFAQSAELVDELASPKPAKPTEIRGFRGDWPGWAVAADWLEPPE